MPVNNVYCFSVHYGYDLDGWVEKDEHGFVMANDFEGAYAQLKAYYGDDILSFSLECVGDTGLISVDNKAMIDMLKDEFTTYHYGCDNKEEDEE